MKIVFFGTPTLSVPFLDALCKESGFEVVAVVTQPDKPVGRKAVLTKPEVKVFAESKQIPVFQFPSLKSEEAQHTLSELHADVFAVFAYGKIIPSAVLAIPRLGCVNVHPSLLPKYRGASPFQQALLDGATSTGVSIIQMDAGMDTGAVLAQQEFQIDACETSVTIQEKIIQVGVPLFVKTLHAVESGTLTPVSQDEQFATTTKLFEKADGKIDWNKSALEIERMVRAFTPWPSAWFTWSDRNEMRSIKLVEAIVGSKIDKPVGTVVCQNSVIEVVCGDGMTLQLVQIQPEGKQKMSATDFARGHQSFCESILS